ncbi:MAG TPA: alpha/beta hydrolase domain-containing protein [Caldimonas sp.]|nr:alpha/beta hydrolase domain-containing protein [Caldimonas sp.]
MIDSTTAVTGGVLAYETLRGRAFGELDPNDPKNATITDIQLGKDADGKVRYEASFTLTKPVNMAQASGFLWHDVPNRGGNIIIAAVERDLGDVGLASAWQADNAGATAVPTIHTSGTNHWLVVPMARDNGQLITGKVLTRIVNRSGVDSAPLNVMGNPVPYLPVSLSTADAVLTTHTKETVNGQITVGSVIPSTDWAFSHCSAANPFPGTPDDNDEANLPGNLPLHVCLKGGFDPNLLYQLTYQAKNAYVLGVGIAAFRDVGSFFKYAANDDFGNANPIAARINWSSMRGSSQSGNFTRQYIYTGMNQDEAGRIVHNGAWPQIAGRRVAANVRWGQPDGVLELYQLGSEGAQWWVDYPDPVRNLPASSIFHRCNLTGTCPKVVEHFGGSEVFALKMTMEWVGPGADVDIPLTRNVRRYYIGSTTHGGGGGGFTWQPPATGASCPGNNWGTGAFRANPMPSTQMINVIRLAMRAWLMTGALPPPSRYPTLIGGTLVDPTRQAMGFPAGVPGVPESIFDPENFVFPVFDYDWGPQFNRADSTGVPTNLPPPINKVIAMKVPRVDADGNELGGVPTVLRDAPLGTYLGWNITAAGFHKGQVCNYVGGYIPFALNAAERATTGDPRLSLVERYQDHAGYVAAVTQAANNAFAQGYLLAVDRDALIAAAQASDVLK